MPTDASDALDSLMCCVEKCLYSKPIPRGKDIQFHRFPIKGRVKLRIKGELHDLHDMWTDRLKIKGINVPLRTYLCSEHFHADDYDVTLDKDGTEKKILHPYAIPSVSLFKTYPSAKEIPPTPPLPSTSTALLTQTVGQAGPRTVYVKKVDGPPPKTYSQSPNIVTQKPIAQIENVYSESSNSSMPPFKKILLKKPIAELEEGATRKKLVYVRPTEPRKKKRKLSPTQETEISIATPPIKPASSFPNILRKPSITPQPVKPQEINLQIFDENSSTESDNFRLELQSDSPSTVVLSEDEEMQPYDEDENDTFNQLNSLTEKIEAQLNRNKDTVRRKDTENIVQKKISTSPQKVDTRPEVILLLTKNVSQASRNSEDIAIRSNNETSQSSNKNPARLIRIHLPNSTKSQSVASDKRILIKKSLPVSSSSTKASSSFSKSLTNNPKILTFNNQKHAFRIKKGIVTIKSNVHEQGSERRYFESVSQFADPPNFDHTDGSHIQIEELNDFQFNPRRRDIEILPVDLQGEGMEQFGLEDDDTRGGEQDSRPGWLKKGVRVLDLCRVCAKHRSDMTEIFSEMGRSYDLPGKVEKCLPITVTESDGLPHWVCGSCMEKIEISSELRESCALADTILKDMREEEEKGYESPIQLPTADTDMDDSQMNDTTQMGDSSEEEDQSRSFVYKRFRKKVVKNPRKKSKIKRKRKPLCLAQQAEPDETGVVVLNCKLCSYTEIHGGPKLRKHYIHRHGTEMCLICCEIFGTDEDKEEHVNNVHKIKCKFCSFKILSKTSLRTHVRENHKKIEVRFIPKSGAWKKKGYCKYCNKIIGTRYVTKQHYYWHHYQYACDLCLTLFDDRQSQENHTEEVHVILCPFCNEKFYNDRILKIHVNMEHKERSIELPSCKKTPEQIFECKSCTKGLTTKLYLKLHCYHVHKKIMCDVCNDEFDTLELEEKHYTENHATDLEPTENITDSEVVEHEYAVTKPFCCEYCGDYFRNREELSQHRPTHVLPPEESVELNTPCPTCDKLFPNATSLSRHAVIHKKPVNDKKFICEFCSKEFPLMSHLKSHLLKHATEREFKCVDCGISYNRQTQLKAHLKTHKVDKGLKCEVCDINFSAKTVLIKHMKIMHDIILKPKWPYYKKKNPQKKRKKQSADVI